MLAEIMSYVGAVASLKADMLANENYLQTARQRTSVKKLLELVGVSMRGPISAAANAKITWEEPAWAVGVGGSSLTIDVGNRTHNIEASEDGGPVSYTLYKVNSTGNVDVANSTGDIVLEKIESDNVPDATVFSNLVLLEGALVKETGTFSNT